MALFFARGRGFGLARTAGGSGAGGSAGGSAGAAGAAGAAGSDAAGSAVGSGAGAAFALGLRSAGGSAGGAAFALGLRLAAELPRSALGRGSAGSGVAALVASAALSTGVATTCFFPFLKATAFPARVVKATSLASSISSNQHLVVGETKLQSGTPVIAILKGDEVAAVVP